MCDGLNAPVAVVRFWILQVGFKWFVFHPWFAFVVENIVYFGLVAFLWYLVSLEIIGWEQKRGSVLTARMPARRLADIFAIAFALVIAFFGEQVRRQTPGIYGTTYWNAVSIPYFIWAIVLVLFFGRDLFLIVKGRIRLAPS